MGVKLFNDKLRYLKSIYKNESNFDEFIEKLLELHSLVHISEMNNLSYKTYADEIWEKYEESTMRSSLNKKGRTIVYGVWHSARIEDLTMNILVKESDQVLNKQWIEKMNATITDTGNSLTEKEILEFSKTINIKELKNYRSFVGRKTRDIIKSLKYNDLKRKVKKENLDKIIEEKGVLEKDESIWLIDFWGKKDVAGILFMPALRHNLVHINESLKVKNISC